MVRKLLIAVALTLAVVSTPHLQAQIPQIDSNHPGPIWKQPLYLDWDAAAALETRSDESPFLFGPADPITVLPDYWPIRAGGWTQVSYSTSNAVFPAGLGSDEDEIQLNQQWVFLEKPIDPHPADFDWGFRVDYSFGSDFVFTQSNGGRPNEWDRDWDNFRYGHSIPQAYVTMAYGDVSVKVGHFITPMGYETSASPYNFFLSHANYFNTIPFTHTGVMFEYTANEFLILYGGWTAGHDTGFTRNHGSNFLGGFQLLLTEDVLLSYIASIGGQGFGGVSDANSYEHSVILTVDVMEDLRSVLYFGMWDDEGFAGGVTYSLANYWYYTINEMISIGGRGEWIKSRFANQGEITLGLNCQPIANLTVRPEVRLDMNDVDFGDNETVQFGVDAILTY